MGKIKWSAVRLFQMLKMLDMESIISAKRAICLKLLLRNYTQIHGNKSLTVILHPSVGYFFFIVILTLAN